MSTVTGNLLNRLSRPTPIPTTIVLGLQYSGQTTFVYFLKSRQIVPTVSGIGFSKETVQVPTPSDELARKETPEEVQKEGAEVSRSVTSAASSFSSRYLSS